MVVNMIETPFIALNIHRSYTDNNLALKKLNAKYLENRSLLILNVNNIDKM